MLMIMNTELSPSAYVVLRSSLYLPVLSPSEASYTKRRLLYTDGCKQPQQMVMPLTIYWRLNNDIWQILDIDMLLGPHIHDPDCLNGYNANFQRHEFHLYFIASRWCKRTHPRIGT